MPITCRHCGTDLTLAANSPLTQEWGFRGGDDDFVCPNRDSSGRWPDGKPHEAAIDVSGPARTTWLPVSDLAGHIIVGDAGGHTRITGETERSSIAGFGGMWRVETEHGVLYLDEEFPVRVLDEPTPQPLFAFRYFETTITLRVLSEDTPATGLSLAALAEEVDTGDCVLADQIETVRGATPEQMADLLTAAGSEPGFFSLADPKDFDD